MKNIVCFSTILLVMLTGNLLAVRLDDNRNFGEIIGRMEELKQRTELKVIENPLYTKKARLEIKPAGGSFMSDPYVDTYFFGMGFAYHFSNLWGVETDYFSAKTKETQLNTEDIKKKFKDKGEIASKTKNFYNLNILFTPIYAKASLLSNLILHYDMFLTAGIGNTTTNWESAFTYNYGLGMRIFLFKRVSLTLSIQDYVHREKRQSLTINKHNVLWLGGLSVYVL